MFNVLDGSVKKQKSIQQDVEIDMGFGNNDDNSDSDLSDSQVCSFLVEHFKNIKMHLFTYFQLYWKIFDLVFNHGIFQSKHLQY